MTPPPSVLLSTGSGVISPWSPRPRGRRRTAELVLVTRLAGGDGDRRRGRRAVARPSPAAQMAIAGDVDVAGDRVGASQHDVPEDALGAGDGVRARSDLGDPEDGIGDERFPLRFTVRVRPSAAGTWR